MDDFVVVLIAILNSLTGFSLFTNSNSSDLNMDFYSTLASGTPVQMSCLDPGGSLIPMANTLVGDSNVNPTGISLRKSSFYVRSVSLPFQCMATSTQQFTIWDTPCDYHTLETTTSAMTINVVANGVEQNLFNSSEAACYQNAVNTGADLYSAARTCAKDSPNKLPVTLRKQVTSGVHHIPDGQKGLNGYTCWCGTATSCGNTSNTSPVPIFSWKF